MIKVENIATWGFKAAIRGMRNPLNSWDKSDSYIELCDVIVGDADLTLMQKLFKGGSEHRKYLRQIFVSMDIVAPLYWYLEFDTYKIGVTSNSCSKMHKLLEKPFEMKDFSFDKLAGYKNEIEQFKPEVDTFKEVWHDFGNDYAVSDYGRICHFKNGTNKILNGSLHQDGYIFVTIMGRQYPVHRLVAEAFIPNPEGKSFVNHIDGNKQNNQFSNLEWCTQSENIIHAVKNNLQPKGLSTYKGKFTAEQRQQIKDEYNSSYISKRQLAKKWGVSHTCIADILNDKYKYVENINLYAEVAKPLIDTLNELRDLYLSCEDAETKKQIWYSILQLLPESYNQRRTVTLNYENVVTMIKQRENHKLDEWRSFIKLLNELPYIKEIMGIA